MNMIRLLMVLLLVLAWGGSVCAADPDDDPVDPAAVASGAIFDDKLLFNGYVEKYSTESKEVLMAMMNDATLGQFKIAAAIHVFNMQFADQIVAAEKNVVEKVFLRLMGHEDSPFVQTEIMHALVTLDRYRYFKVMVPRLIEKIDHYNSAVSDIAYDNLTAIISSSKARTREARIIFNTLRKVLFLSRKKLEYVQEPDEKLQRKLDLLFWSIKVLGTQELKQLPPEVIRLM
jgi:hypothetical protein